MKRKNLYMAAALLAAFVLWTVLIRFVDVRAIGPEGSEVGFSRLNQAVHDLTGVNPALYEITDWLGLLPIATMLFFACLGLAEWISRKSLFRVDRDILALGVLYLALMAAYLLFETVVINYRPTLIEGHLEVSYPSSTTLLVMCVMPTAGMQMRRRCRSIRWRWCGSAAISLFCAVTVGGRVLSGVHWITDIVGGLLLSAALITAYRAALCHLDENAP